MIFYTYEVYKERKRESEDIYIYTCGVTELVKVCLSYDFKIENYTYI